MVLESLRPDAPVNIKNLVIESPKKQEAELLFDPKRDITEDDLRAMDVSLKARDSMISPYWIKLRTFAILKLLFPNRPLPVNLNKRENIEKAKRAFNNKGVDLLSLRVLYPQVPIKEFGETGSAFFEERLSEVVNDWKFKTSAYAISIELIYAFNPEKVADLLKDKDLKGYLLYGAKDSLRQNTISGWNLAGHIAAARILLEDDFDLELSREHWQKMHRDLRNDRANGEWHNFALLARNMYILAAEKVRVSPEGGLVLTMPQPKPDFRQHIPPLPQMRRF